MTKENPLSSYSSEQMEKGEAFPEKISSLSFDVEAGERLKLEFIMERLEDLLQRVREKTNREFVVFGSMGMYILLHELKKQGEPLMILEQRISGGKNDCDIGVDDDDFEKIMDDFGWNTKAKELHRGKLPPNTQIVDLMKRKHLSRFPWKEIRIGNSKCLVVNPEEMIFGSENKENITRLLSSGSPQEFIFCAK